MKKKKKSYDPLYLNLQQSFIKIRTLFSVEPTNPHKLDAVLGDLRFARKQLQKHAKRRPRKILTECIDTLFEMIEEGNREKICDFADLIHNMPEIGSRKRSFHSFIKEINAFNNKYEEFCFSDINTIHINISKETFQKIIKPGEVKFWPMFISGITAFLLPLILHIIYIGRLTNGQDFSGFSILAFLATLTIGVGFANIFFSLAFQYHGRKFSIITLSVGGFALALSIYMIKNPQLCDENISILHYASLLFMLLVPTTFYLLFRSGVEDWVMRTKHISKSRFKKLKTGKKNYWWFEALHKEENLGKIYHLNKTFTSLYTILFVLTLFIGFKKEMHLILCPMNLILYILTAYMYLFSKIQHNILHYGKPFILLARSPNKSFDSSFFDIIAIVIILTPAYIVLVMTADIWGISLPTL